MQTGIHYPELMPGTVPLIEEFEAARFNGYTWHQWEALPYVERVYGVAFYRMERVIEMHREDAISRKIEGQRPKYRRRS